MGEAIRLKNWSETPLGPIANWPRSLRTTVSLRLASNFPIDGIWGPEHIQIYKDGYRPICAGKHPKSLGEDYTKTWASAWEILADAFDRALAGQTSFLENQRIFLDRNGHVEETFFTFQMLSQRRTRALQDPGSQAGSRRALSRLVHWPQRR